MKEKIINILEIPFYSKSKMKEEVLSQINSKGCKIKGKIYYFVTNKNRIIYKSAEIFDGSYYRANDYNLIGAIGYLKNVNKNPKSVKDYNLSSIFTWRMENFRPNIKDLDLKNSIEKFIIHQKDQKINSEWIQMNATELENINNLLSNNSNINTSLGIIGLLSGSNVSGSIKNHNANPLLIREGKYSGYNFTQAFGNNKINSEIILLSNYKFSNDEEKENFENINMETFISRCSDTFKVQFYAFNKTILSDYEDELIRNDEWSNNLIEYSKEIQNKDIDYFESILLLEAYFERGEIDEKQFKSKLRTIYQNRVELHLKDHKIESFFKDAYIPEYHSKCHIVSFAYLFNKGEYFKAADFLNYVPFDPNLHKGFDKGDYLIELDGRVVNVKTGIVKIKLSDKCVESSKEYIEEAYDFYKKTRKATAQLGYR